MDIQKITKYVVLALGVIGLVLQIIILRKGDDAIEMAGGYKPNSLKNRAFITRANGEREKTNIFRGRAKRVFAGDSIFIPVDTNPSDFDITTFIADLSSTLANIAAILIIVDNNN